ncbi:MAG TPA: pilus assembly protein PilM [Solirubrobacteraceae bacterium]|nr:pilus assembly protein PilM [Solirubrobacteraceae bacterium]
MFKRKRASKTRLVGLELDPGHLAAAEVSADGSLSLDRGAVAHLRPGILRDGDVTDAPALTEALRALFEEHDLPKRVRLGIANQRIVVRSLDLPLMDDEKALFAAARTLAPDHIPMPIDEAVLDMQSLGVVDTPAGPRIRVVVVAVRREMVERITAAAREAGLTVEGIDLSAFGMLRALPAPEAGRAVLYVNAAGLVNVAVANPAGCLFTRAAAGGLDAMAATLAERRGLTLEHARQWIQHVGLAAPLAEVEGDPELVAAVRATLEEGVHEMADTVRNSLNFYRMQESAETVDRAVLTGPGVEVEGLAARLADLLRLPVDVALVGSGAEQADAGRLTVAAGLAVAERP